MKTHCLAILGLLFVIAVGPTEAATSLDSKLRTDGTQLREAFGEVAGGVAKACTVNIWSGAKFTGLGTVVTKDGIVVAKNSEIDTFMKLLKPIFLCFMMLFLFFKLFVYF